MVRRVTKVVEPLPLKRLRLYPPLTSSNSVPPSGLTGQVLAKASDDDGDTEWVPAGATATFLFPPATTVALEDITAAINTGATKVAGLAYYNTNTGKVVVAAGNADGDVWTDTLGTTLHTPI